MTHWNSWAERELAGLRAINRYRQTVPFDGDAVSYTHLTLPTTERV